MIFCFNELSLQNLDTNIIDNEILEETLLKFLLILKNAVDEDGFPEVRTENGMWGTVINDRPINELIYNSTIDKDLKNLIFRIQDRSPYIDDKEIDTYFYGEDKRSAKGFSASLYLDCPAISLSSFTGEDKSIILLTKEGESPKFVFNFTNDRQFKEYLEFYLSSQHCLNYIANVADLKEQASQGKFWENLFFHDGFSELELDNNIIRNVVKKLCQWNSFFYSFPDEKHTFLKLREILNDVRDESTTVKNNKQLREERMAQFDGKSIMCTYHSSLDSSNRLYFSVNYNERIAYIGYIGKHLTTAKFKSN